MKMGIYAGRGISVLEGRVNAETAKTDAGDVREMWGGMRGALILYRKSDLH